MVLIWTRGLRHLCTLVVGFKETFMQSLSVFLLFFGGKKGPAFRSSIYFYPLIIEFFFYLSSYGSESRKRYNTKVVADPSREGGFLEVILFGKGQMAYATVYVTNGLRDVTVTSPKTFSKILRTTYEHCDCFWKFLYCITRKLHISEYVCKTCVIEFGIFLRCTETSETLQPVTLLKMLPLHVYFSAIFLEQLWAPILQRAL